MILSKKIKAENMHLVIATILLCIWPYILFSQNVYWDQNFGGSDFDATYHVEQTSDGGYIMAGYTSSTDMDVVGNFGNDDFWVVKLHADGSLDWKQNYGGSDDDRAYDIQQTNDGGYIVAGSSESNDFHTSDNYGGNDYWVVKLDASGIIDWQQNYGGSGEDVALSVQQTSDSSYIVAGQSTSDDQDVSGNHGFQDYWILKLESDGSIEWEEHYGGSATDIARSVQQTSDGGYIVAGQSSSDDNDISFNYGIYDYWILKLNANGSIDWEQNYGGNLSENLNAIQQTSDGGYVLAGRSASNDGDVAGNYGDTDYWIVKLRANSTIEWEQNYGGSDWDEAFSVEQTNDGGYVVVGSSSSNDNDVSGNYGNSDYWIVKLDAVGAIKWEENYGGSGGDLPHAVQQTAGDDYIVTGRSESGDHDVTSGNYGDYDHWTFRLCLSTDETIVDIVGDDLQAAMDSATYQWGLCDDGYSPIDGATNQTFKPDADGNYAVVINKNGCPDTSWCYSVIPTEIAEKENKLNDPRIYPNPVEDKLTIELGESHTATKIEITNINGKILVTKEIPPSVQSTTLSLNVKAGAYFIKVQQKEKSKTFKVIKQ